ncbi:MAG: hypothetical protein KDD65_01625 [Bacteroidetes bacterium]|nr:hypothetical protein [Bacteroidota bacterium]
MTTRSASKPKKKTGQRAAVNARVRTAKPEIRANAVNAFRLPLFRQDEQPKKQPRRGESRVSRLVDSAGAVRKSGRDHGRLPTWREIDSKKNTRVASRSNSRLDQISTARLAAVIALCVVAFTFYIGNVHATQQELERLHRVQAENSRLRMKLNRVKGDYDLMTGPSRIYDRARQIGLVESEPRVPQIVYSPQ